MARYPEKTSADIYICVHSCGKRPHMSVFPSHREVQALQGAVVPQVESQATMYEVLTHNGKYLTWFVPQNICRWCFNAARFAHSSCVGMFVFFALSTNHTEKRPVSRDCPTFSRTCIFLLLTFSSFIFFFLSALL